MDREPALVAAAAAVSALRARARVLVDVDPSRPVGAAGAASAGVLLGACTALFLGLAASLRAGGLDQTAILRAAPIAWACAGALFWGAAVAYVRKNGWAEARLELASPAEYVSRRAWFWGSGLVLCTVLGVALVAEPFISYESRLSWPYRLVKWAIVDRIDVAVSNECLAMRAIEYGDRLAAGKLAMDELYKRDRSAVDGVAAKLDDLAENWPPKKYTTTTTGIREMLRFLKWRGETTVTTKWQSIPYYEDLAGAEPPFVLSPANVMPR